MQIERDKLMKEKQTREEIMKQRDELEKKLLEFQEEASRVKEALVWANNYKIIISSWMASHCQAGSTRETLEPR